MAVDVHANGWSRRIGAWLSWIVPDAVPAGGVEWWRGRILAAVLLTCVIAGFLILVPSLAVAVQERAWSVVATDAVLYPSMIGLLLARRLGRTTRAWGIILICWALGTFFSWGWAGSVAGPIWLMAVPVLAGVLLGIRSTIFALGLTAVTTIGIGALAAAGLTPWTGGPALEIPSPGPLDGWMIIATNMLFVAGLGALGAAVLARGLAELGAARARAEADLLLIGRALEQGESLVLLLDPSGRIVRANDADLWAQGPVEAGQSIDDLALCTIEPRAAPIPWRDVFAGQPWAGRGQRRPPSEATRGPGDGPSPGTWQVVLNPVRDADGTVTHVLCVVRDVSPQVALEARLRTSAKLEAVGTLVGGIAHDFNNLLQPILSNAGELRQLLGVSHPGAPMLDDIEASAERGRSLVRRILTFSRGIDVPRVPTALASVVEEALRLTDVRATALLAVTVHVDGDPWVLADPAELHHVVVNLLSNARDAMPHGGRLELDVAREAGGTTFGAQAVIRVGDTGMGMDERTQQRMFEPFFSTKAPGRGTGLGLATVHGTVRALGGTIDVQSQPGRGTTITVRLPAIDAPSAARPSGPSPAGTQAAGLATVMVVDDDDAVRRAAVRLLARAGYRTIDAADPREAVARIASAPDTIDLVLTDFTMPHLSGADLAVAVREVAPAVPVVLMTGIVETGDAAGARAEGVAAVLAKPFSPSELTKTIDDVLRRSRAVGTADR